MDSFSAQDATSALNLLFEVALHRQKEINSYDSVRDQGRSDEENDSPCPYFDQFFANGGNQAIMDMCNFFASEFEFLWLLTETFIKRNYNVGRGNKCHARGKTYCSCY